MGSRAQRQYDMALTNYRTRQALLARQWQALLEHPVAPTAVIRPGESRSPGEIAQREQERKLQKAYGEYVENVNLISGGFAPLVLYDPVIQGTAQGGLMVMGGAALGGVAAGLPASLRWLGAGVEAGTGLRASYSALRTAPQLFLQGAEIRLLTDISAQYTANLILGNGYLGSFGEINFIETGMSTVGFNPYTTAIVTGGLSFSIHNRLQSVFHSEASGHNISKAKFVAQAAVGLGAGYFGGRVEERLAESNYRA